MLNHTDKQTAAILETIDRADDALVKLEILAFQNAARRMEEACKRCRNHIGTAMEDLYTDEMNAAIEAFEVAADDYRQAVYGYRHTYPHPVALAPHGSRYPVR